MKMSLHCVQCYGDFGGYCGAFISFVAASFFALRYKYLLDKYEVKALPDA